MVRRRPVSPGSVKRSFYKFGLAFYRQRKLFFELNIKHRESHIRSRIADVVGVNVSHE